MKYKPVVGLCLLLVGLTGCQGAQSSPNVLLIMVDTLRADVIGPELTPNVESWSRDAIRFERAVSPSTWTVPSVASLFSGVHPSVHGVHKLGVDKEGKLDIDLLAQEQITLAEVLQQAGYKTLALIHSRVIRNRGFDQGFDEFRYIERGVHASGPSAGFLTDAALRRLASAEQPFFLYLHYMDPHVPYHAPEPWRGRYSAGIESNVDGTAASIESLRQGQVIPDEKQVTKLLRLYQEEVSYLDEQLQRVFEGLVHHELAENTVVVLTSDHGEAFWEHGEFTHGGLGFQEKIHVPLIIRAPSHPPRRSREWTHGLDIAPTIAGLAGVEAPGTWQGRNLFNEGNPRRALIAEVPNKGDIVIDTRTGAKLFISDKQLGPLFDLEFDPGESIDTSSERAHTVEQLTAFWNAHHRHNKVLRGGHETVSASEALSAEERAALEALGYL